MSDREPTGRLYLGAVVVGILAGLIAAGAAAGLAAAINAPLAAIVFITEEWREHCHYSFSAIQTVMLACALAVIVSGWALGTIFGSAVDEILVTLAPGLRLTQGVFAVAAMGAVLAATIRAPLTGILMVIEMTGALSLALPIVMTCLVATYTAEALGGRPLYRLMLEQAAHPPARLKWPALRVVLAGVMLAVLVVISHR